MPRYKNVTKLESLALNQFCKNCAWTCTTLEETELENEEARFKSFLVMLPRTMLELAISETLKIITGKVRKNRSHKGLIKALECLPQASVQKLDFGSLYSQVRLYGSVNAKLKEILEQSFSQLPNLIELNLSSKCSDEILIQVAKNCPNIEVINVALSDISDQGLMALAGISFSNRVKKSLGHGCSQLVKLNVQNCDYITDKGVGCLIRNLKKVQYLYYDKLFDALETVIKINPEYLDGDEKIRIKHIDQFGEFYVFDAHPGLVQAVAKVCPEVESFRFYIDDKGCQSLRHFPHIKHLQLEISENLGPDFQNLVNNYLPNLISLQLTYRNITSETLAAIGQNCPNIEVMKLIGYKILHSETLTVNPAYFTKLKVLEIRVVKSDERFEDFVDFHHEDEEEDSSITPNLLNFFLQNCHNIQDITISAMLNCLDEPLLMLILQKNAMSELQRLCICPLNKASNHLTASVALNVIMALPNLHSIALSRWRMKSKEINEIRKQCKHQNLYINFL